MNDKTDLQQETSTSKDADQGTGVQSNYYNNKKTLLYVGFISKLCHMYIAFLLVIQFEFWCARYVYSLDVLFS